MRKILLIGGAGYVGTVLADHLLTAGYSVRALDCFLYKNHQSIHGLLGRRGFEFIYGDLCAKDVLDRALQDVSEVVLLAGLVGDPVTKKYPDAARLINEEGIRSCFLRLQGKRIRRLVFVSTCSNYGLIPEGILAGEQFPLNPLSLYAQAKVESEKILMDLHGKVDYEATILRFATAFGLSPRMRFDLTISEFTKELALGRELSVFDPDTWRPYCHVRDFARLIELVLNAPSANVAFQIFNAGGENNNLTKRAVVQTICKHLPHAKVQYQQEGSDPRNYRVSFKKIQEILGFVPQYSVEDGIVELLEAIRTQCFNFVNTGAPALGNYEIHYQE